MQELARMRELGLCPREVFVREAHFHEALARRLELEHTLTGHDGCVNRLTWNADGTRLASGSDDRKILIWSVPEYERAPLVVDTNHRANIFGVQFLPCTGDTRIASGAMDHTVQLHVLDEAHTAGWQAGRCGAGMGGRVDARKRSSQVFFCHSNRVKDVKTEPANPHNFWSASEDGTVRQFDARLPTAGQDAHASPNVLLSVRGRGGGGGYGAVELKALDICSTRPHLLAVACGGTAHAHVYDRRMLSLHAPPLARGSAPPSPRAAPLFSLAPTHLTCAGGVRFARVHSTYVAFSRAGDQLLVSYNGDHAYAFDVRGGGGGGYGTGTEPATAYVAPPQGHHHHHQQQQQQRRVGGASPLAHGVWVPACTSTRALARRAQRPLAPTEVAAGTPPPGALALPPAAEAARRRGNRAMFEEEWPAAVAALTDALSIAPWSASLCGRRAEAYLRRGWKADALWALQDCEAAIERGGNACPVAHLRRVRALQALKQLQCALAALDDYVRRFPERAHAEELVALRTSLEHSAASRDKQTATWLQQRRAVKRSRLEAERSLSEGRHTPRPMPPRHMRSVTVGDDGGGGASNRGEVAQDRGPGGRGGRGGAAQGASISDRGSGSGGSGSGGTSSGSSDSGGGGSGSGGSSSGGSDSGGGSGDLGVGGVRGRRAGSGNHSGGGGGSSWPDASAFLVERRSRGAASGGGGGGSGTGSDDSGGSGTGSDDSSGSGTGSDDSGGSGSGGGGGGHRGGGRGAGAWISSGSSDGGAVGSDEDDDDDSAMNEDHPARELLWPFYSHLRGGSAAAGSSTCRMPPPPPPPHAQRTPASQPRSLAEALRGRVTGRYIGHVNNMTDIKEATFLGRGDSLVAAGSDDGRVYVYQASTGVLLRALLADEDVVNCVQGHPHAALLATSGIESAVRVWSPGLDLRPQDAAELESLVAGAQQRNAQGPAVMRASHLQSLADSPHLRNLLLQLYGRDVVTGSRTPGEAGDDEDGDGGDDENGDSQAEVSCRVN